MCQFIETIRMDFGQARDLVYHQARMNRTYQHFFRMQNPFILQELIICPENLHHMVVKCRVTYSGDTIKTEYEAYRYKRAASFLLVEGGNLDYSFKYADRTAIEKLQPGNDSKDDIIIIKNGKVTDASYANLVFKKTRWLYTPDNPLLSGTKLQKYLDQGKLRIRPIPVEDLHLYTHFKRINAMLDLEDTEWIPISDISLQSL